MPAGDADLRSVVALMNAAYRGAGAPPGWTTEAGYITGSRTTEDLLRSDLAASPDACLLLWRDRDDGALKGCVWLQPIDDAAWYLGSLTIQPARQKSGFGDALLRAAECWIGERGGRRVRMSVVNVRDILIAWYVRRGYRRTGETEPFPYGDDRFGTPLRDDLSFVILEKDLVR